MSLHIVNMHSSSSYYYFPSPQAGTEDVKSVISKLSELRYQLETDKPMEAIAHGDDIKEWAAVFDVYRSKFKGENPKWFAVSWLFAECFMYRKMVETIRERSETFSLLFFFLVLLVCSY